MSADTSKFVLKNEGKIFLERMTKKGARMGQGQKKKDKGANRGMQERHEEQ